MAAKMVKAMAAAVSLSMLTAGAAEASTGNWVASKPVWSYVLEDGSVVKNSWIQNADGTWYHVDPNGVMETGWFTDADGATYYLDDTGAMAVGWKSIKDDAGTSHWHYFQENGQLKTGWHQETDGSWRYLNAAAKGAPSTGWILVNQKYYYLDSNGVLLENTVTPDGYRVNGEGAWVDENGNPVIIRSG